MRSSPLLSRVGLSHREGAGSSPLTERARTGTVLRFAAFPCRNLANGLQTPASHAKSPTMTALDENAAEARGLAEAMAEAPANAAPPIPQGGLEVVSIAKSYDKRAVLHDISLTVGKGEVLGLLGPNGAGKTTCFYSIMGLVRPDSGRILMDGVDVTRLPMYRRAILGLGDVRRSQLRQSQANLLVVGGPRRRPQQRLHVLPAVPHRIEGHVNGPA